MERQIEKFYRKWSPAVLAFCCALLGEGAEAEETTMDAFHAYLSRGLDLDLVGVPAFLFLFAIDAAKNAAFRPRAEGTVQRLEDAVVLLPWKERSVFALRSVMLLDDLTISEIAEIPLREVQKTWVSALFHLRELLHKDFFCRRKR